jgi:hypothetical protein
MPQVALWKNTLTKCLHLSTGNKVTNEVIALLTFPLSKNQIVFGAIKVKKGLTLLEHD